MLEYTLILRRLDKRFAFMWVIFFLNIVPIHIFYGFVCRHTQYMECDFPSDHICIRIFISTLSAIKGDCKKEFNPQAGNVYNKFSYYYCIVWDFYSNFVENLPKIAMNMHTDIWWLALHYTFVCWVKTQLY